MPVRKGMGDDDSFTYSFTVSGDGEERPMDMKRDLASMIAEVKSTAEDAHARIDRAVADSTAQLEASAAFWEAAEEGARHFPEFLMGADHVVTLRMHLPKAERVQIGLHAWGSGPTADLYSTKDDDYDVLVVFQRRRKR